MPTATRTTTGARTASGSWSSSATSGCSPPQVGLVSSDGKGKVINLTQSGFDNVDARWGMDGTMMYWGCTREGAANRPADRP